MSTKTIGVPQKPGRPRAEHPRAKSIRVSDAFLEKVRVPAESSGKSIANELEGMVEELFRWRAAYESNEKMLAAQVAEYEKAMVANGFRKLRAIDENGQHVFRWGFVPVADLAHEPQKTVSPSPLPHVFGGPTNLPMPHSVRPPIAPPFESLPVDEIVAAVLQALDKRQAPAPAATPKRRKT